MKFVYMVVFILVIGLTFFGLSRLSTDTVSVMKKEVVKTPEEQPIISMDEKVVEVEDIEKPVEKPVEKLTVKEKAYKKIAKKISVYLMNDTFELKRGMTLAQVDKIWGEPDEVDREYDGTDKEMYWEYGNFWQSQSKLKGLYYYKNAKFTNGKLLYWTKSGDIKIKTHSRDDVFKNHLDEGTDLVEGMNKLKVFELWGLPASFEVRCFSNDEIETKWHFDTNNHLSHYVVFKNSKVMRWGNY